MENYEKKYKDALERLRTLVNSAKKKGHIIVRTEDIEDTFPELKENEDEKIRKALIELVKYSKKSCFEILKDKSFNIVSMDTMLSWLEKQGDSQVDQEIQKVINENFFDMIGEKDTSDKLISLNKACEWLKNKLPSAMVRSDFYMFNGEFIEDFKKAMEGGEE